jgi:ribosome recycling factor
MYQELLKEKKKEFDAVLDWAKSEVGSIRTGRANPDMVSDITVDYMGTSLRIKELGSISIPDARSILIQPWDKGALGAIEGAVRASSLGLSPVVDGVSVRLTIPPLIEERRKEYIKLLGGKVEEARIRFRHVREDILKRVQAGVKDKTLREDDARRAKDELQKVIDDYNAKLQEVATAKEKELLSV